MLKYLIALLFANALWSGSYSIMKWGIADIHPISLVFYRMALAALLLWPAVFIFARKQLRELDRSFIFRIILVALFDLVHQVGLCIGVDYTYATDAALIISMEPVFLFFLATLILREELSIRHIFSLILAITGFIVLSDLTSISLDFSKSMVLLGNMIILFAVISETGFTIFFKPLAKSYSPILLMAMVTLIQSILLMPIAYSVDPNWLNLALTAKNIVVICYLTIFCTVFGYVIWLFIMGKIPVNIMAVSLFLQPALGPIIAAVTLGEKIGPRILIGGTVIVFSLYIVSSRRLRVRRPVTADYT